MSIKEANHFFPLYLFPTEKEVAIGIKPISNFDEKFVVALTKQINAQPDSKDIFGYIYAVLFAKTYRERYSDLLKVDYARIPLPPKAELFYQLANLGTELIELHLLSSPELNQHGIAFPISGNHVVKKMDKDERYVWPTSEGQPGRVRLNEMEYFANVSPECYNFSVGGSQPAYKWLDDRVGRSLIAADISHYRRMLAAMRATVERLPAIDAIFRQMLGLEPVIIA